MPGTDDRRDDHVAQRPLGVADAVEQRRPEEAERAQHADETQDPRRVARRSSSVARVPLPPT